METTGDHDKILGKTAKVPTLCSQRWNLATIGFFGFLFVYVVRVNLSVAIICMVRVPRDNLSTNPLYFSEDVTTLSSIDMPMLPSTMNPVQDNGKLDTKKDAELNDEDSCGGGLTQNASSPAYTGELDWDKATRSRLLAMYFYGYIFTQIPGGWLAGRYGGRRVWGFCQAVCAICTLFTPLAARTHVYLAYTLRFLLGLAAGVSFPCFHAMMGRWAPKLERSKLVAFAFAGPSIGTILTFSLSALLCSYGFDNGWGSIFYLAGAGNVLWVIVWAWVTADTPSKHKRISAVERDYILDSIGEKPDAKVKIATPWKAIFTSGPLWAIIAAHMCNNYTNYTLLTSLPTFMKEVLKFDIKQNGALSALPYLCQAVVVIITGHVADFVRARGILSTKCTRKVIQIVAFMGTAVCIVGAGYMTCDQRPLAVLLLCLCLVSMGLGRSGYGVNHIDLAPRHAGVLFGITNTAGTIPGMVAPLVAGALTPNRTAEEWRIVFFICAGLATLGAVVFGLLADGELQSWASPPPEEIIIEDVSRDETAQDKITLQDECEEKITLDAETPESHEKKTMEKEKENESPPVGVDQEEEKTEEK